jgi:hypothetical protein
MIEIKARRPGEFLAKGTFTALIFIDGLALKT